MGTRTASPPDPDRATVVHLIDGTYELYRHFYGQRSFNKGEDRPFAAVLGKPADIGGYYKADTEKVKAVMRPSPTFNAAIAAVA